MKKVEVTIDIHANPRRIISAFTDAHDLRNWWGVEQSLINKIKGGLYTLTWNNSSQGFGYVTSGIIKEYNPDQILVIDNLVYLNPSHPFLGPMTLTVQAMVKGPATQVYLCQDGYQDGDDWDWYYTAVQQAWPAVMQTLKTYVEK